MPLFSFEGNHPTIHATEFIAPTAVIVGDDTVEKWWGAPSREAIATQMEYRVSNKELTLWLAGPQSSAARPMPDGRRPERGGWNRFVVEVEDLVSECRK